MSLFKKVIAVLCVLTLMFSTFSVYATSDTSDEQPIFSDVPQGYWAYDAIQLMAQNNIVDSSTGKFRPEAITTRAEFATMLTIALNLPLKNPDKPTFKDIPKTNWAYRYVETAKYYLTGFRTTTGDYFKPNDAVRKEDMAVALVKALGYGNETADESILNNLKDKSGISKNLKKYVAVALSKGIIESDAIANSKLKMFNPKASQTRATVAVLLSNVIQEEKVTYDDESIDNLPQNYNNNDDNYVDNGTYTTPKVTVTAENGKLLVKWQKISDDRLQGYKIVVSKKCSTPKYPENGYLYWITDKNKTSVYVDNSYAYNNGDFGKYLTAGESYYISVTAVYDEIKLPGNAVKITYPVKLDEYQSNQSSVKIANLTYKIIDGKIALYWNKVDGDDFNYYKVVISKDNKNPKYPEDGYLYYFTDVYKTSCTVDIDDPYNGGDFGGYLESGEDYYFSITAVYGDEKNAGNVVKIEVP